MNKYITPERVTIFVLILFIIILLFWKPCNKPGGNIEKLQAENKEIRNELKQKEDTINIILAKYVRDTAELAGREQLAVIEKKEADKKVEQQQNTIDRLAAKVRAFNSFDTVEADLVAVSRVYKEACDSLPNEIDKLNRTIAEKDTAINAWTDILAYEVQQRDSTIDALGVQIGKVMDLNKRQNKITEDALKAARPRGRLLGGVGLIGNELNPLSGTKINIAYQSKGGKQYQVGGILLRGQVYYEATVLITLIK